MATTDDLQMPHPKFGIDSIEPGLQDLKTALLLMPLDPAAVSGHGLPRPSAADWASKSSLERSYCAPYPVGTGATLGGAI
jgi:hypothetical protein